MVGRVESIVIHQGRKDVAILFRNGWTGFDELARLINESTFPSKAGPNPDEA
jgi:hypothetical protein